MKPIQLYELTNTHTELHLQSPVLCGFTSQESTTYPVKAEASTSYFGVHNKINK